MSDVATVRAIDCWVNPFTPEHAAGAQPEFLVRVATDYFHRAEALRRGTPLDEMVAMMDAAGIERGILTINAAAPQPFAEMAARYPGRFLLSAVIDPLQGMGAVRTIERLVKEHDVRLMRLVPFLFNRPPNDKVCYPIYAKCIELDIPVNIHCGINFSTDTGMDYGRPQYLDAQRGWDGFHDEDGPAISPGSEPLRCRNTRRAPLVSRRSHLR